jgi:hypothetical protein
MTVAVTLEFPTITPEQYDRACALMGLTPRGPGPAGMLFHWAGVVGEGMLIIDVWATRERFDEFAREQIVPRTREAGITTPPKITFDDVHNYFTAGPQAAPTAPVAIVMDFDGDLKQYDEIVDLMDLTSKGPGPEGALFHWVTGTEGGMHITDVWRDRATFDTFAETQIGPYAAKVGMEPAKAMAAYDVYNYFTAGL